MHRNAKNYRNLEAMHALVSTKAPEACAANGGVTLTRTSKVQKFDGNFTSLQMSIKAGAGGDRAQVGSMMVRTAAWEALTKSFVAPAQVCTSPHQPGLKETYTALVLCCPNIIVCTRSTQEMCESCKELVKGSSGGSRVYGMGRDGGRSLRLSWRRPPL